jgi:hypothetical protein
MANNPTFGTWQEVRRPPAAVGLLATGSGKWDAFEAYLAGERGQ